MTPRAPSSAVSKDLRARHPDTPWRWREDWAQGRIGSADGATALVAWVFALAFGGFSAPMIVARRDVLLEGGGEALVLLIFPLAALGLLAWAIVSTARWMRFGRAVVELSTRPGCLGGKVAGTVHLGRTLDARAPYALTLTCTRKRKSGKNTTETILWQDEREVAAASAGRGPAGTAVRFEFVVPYELPASMVEAERGEQILWRLQIEAELPGADLSSSFELPVFETGESSPDVTDRLGVSDRGERPGAEPQTGARAAAPSGGDDAPLEVDRDIRIRRLGDGALEVHFPSGRNKAGAAFFTLFTAMWMGFVCLAAAHMPNGLMRLFMAPFFLVGLLLTLFVPAAWLQRTTVTARRGQLEIRTRSFGRGRPRTLDAGEIESIAAVAKGSAGGKAMWSIQAKTGRRQRTAGQELRSKRDAQRLASMLWREITGEG